MMQSSNYHELGLGMVTREACGLPDPKAFCRNPERVAAIHADKVAKSAAIKAAIAAKKAARVAARRAVRQEKQRAIKAAARLMLRATIPAHLSADARIAEDARRAKLRAESKAATAERRKARAEALKALEDSLVEQQEARTEARKVKRIEQRKIKEEKAATLKAEKAERRKIKKEGAATLKAEKAERRRIKKEGAATLKAEREAEKAERRKIKEEGAATLKAAREAAKAARLLEKDRLECVKAAQWREKRHKTGRQAALLVARWAAKRDGYTGAEVENCARRLLTKYRIISDNWDEIARRIFQQYCGPGNPPESEVTEWCNVATSPTNPSELHRRTS